VNPGDLVLCHTKGIIGASIRWSQRFMDSSNYSKWNHVAILDRFVDGQWYVIQAQPKGITDNLTLTESAFGGTYEVVELPSTTNRDLVLRFARSQVGLKYSYLSILSCALDNILPDAICLRKANTWICSGLVAGALWHGGFPGAIDWPDLYSITPAEVAEALKIV
jgi:hypothetical protein